MWVTSGYDTAVAISLSIETGGDFHFRLLQSSTSLTTFGNDKTAPPWHFQERFKKYYLEVQLRNGSIHIWFNHDRVISFVGIEDLFFSQIASDR